ncbi:MAG: glycosyltransferase [Chloroflexia bacterium]|nr:glycosyltransferase [Chloroflexia bacterium]
MLRPVLLITHDWPPIRTAGTERVLRLAQHLPAFGYRPLILTTNRHGRLESDQEQGIFRAKDWVHDLFRRLQQQRKIHPISQEALSQAIFPNESLLGRLRDRLMLPDTKLGWFWSSVALGHQIIQQEHPVLLFSSSPPETAHLIARRLSQQSGVPWIADLRDGWTFEPPNSTVRQGTVRIALEKRMERFVLHQATHLVTATPPIAEDLISRYPLMVDHISTITNGYEESEFTGLTRQRQSNGELLLVYTGSLAASRGGTSATQLFAGITHHRQVYPNTPLRLEVIGHIQDREQAQVLQLGLQDLVSFLPPISRQQALQHQLDADALLLVTAPGQRSVATLKLFEYIRAGRPIFALAQNNTAADIIAQDDLGILVPPDDPIAIAEGLNKLLMACQTGKSWPGFAQAQVRYDRRVLTEHLALIFDRILAI